MYQSNLINDYLDTFFLFGEFTLYYFPIPDGIETIFYYVRLTLQFVEDELKEERSFLCH